MHKESKETSSNRLENTLPMYGNDYGGFLESGSISLHPTRPQQMQMMMASRPPPPPNSVQNQNARQHHHQHQHQQSVVRPINIAPTYVPGSVPVEVHAPFQQQHSQNIPTRVHQRQPPSTGSLIAARKRAGGGGSGGGAAASAPQVTTLTSGALVEPRLEHLEKLIKDVCENITAVDNAQTAFEHRSNGEWMIADIVTDTVEFASSDDDCESVIKTTTPTAVEKGATASVAYPMVQATLEGDEVYLMRRRQVDPSTAEITASWLVVHSPQTDIAHVTNYRFN